MTEHEPGSWRSRLTPEYVRSRVADTNDGVLAIAGLAEGLAIATTQSIGAVVAIAAIGGAVSVAGVKYTEEAAEREVQQDLIREEQRLLELSPEEEMYELAQHFEVTGQVNSKSWTLHLVPRDPTLAQWLSAVDLQGNQFVQEVKLQEVRGDASMIRILSPGAESALRPQDAAQFE